MKQYVIQEWSGPDMDKSWKDYETHPRTTPDSQGMPTYFDWNARLKTLKEYYPNTIFQCVIRKDEVLYVTK
jgi:hypothetical protein